MCVGGGILCEMLWDGQGRIFNILVSVNTHWIKTDNKRPGGSQQQPAPTSHHTNCAGASTSCEKVEETLQRAVSAMTSVPLIVTPVSCPQGLCLVSGLEQKLKEIGKIVHPTSPEFSNFDINIHLYSDIYNIYRMSLFKVPGCGCSWFNEVS